MAASIGRGARLKGSNFERELANTLTEKLNIKFKRGIGQTRGGGSEVSDVVCEQLPFMHIEAKKQIKCNIKAAMRQAQEDAPTKTPVVITRDDRQPILVTMLFDDWVQLLQDALSEPSKWRLVDSTTETTDTE